MSSGRLLAVAATLCAFPETAAGQRWQVEASGMRVQFDTADALNAASIAPLVEWRAAGLYGLAFGSLASLERSGWSAQGRVDLSLLQSPFGLLSPVRFEVLGMGSGTYHSSGFRTAGTQGEARLHLSARHIGGWVGGGAATGWTSSESAVAFGAGPTAALWGRHGQARATIMATTMRLEGHWLPEARAYLSVAAGPLDIVIHGGARGAPPASGVESETWAGAAATWWFTRHSALTLGGGTYASDLLQGLPSGRYLSAGLRVAGSRPTAPSVNPLGRPAYEPENGAGLLRFQVPGASVVQLVGDWTNWTPVPMERDAGGSWVLRVHLPTGVYRFNLIVEGEQWIVPPGVTWVDDGFGDRSGLLIVP
jgi:hypothetical protein